MNRQLHNPLNRIADSELRLRPANEVMDLERLGSLHPFRLSFMRTLVRRIMREKWRIECTRFDLDKNGYGTAIYEIESPGGEYSFVVFAHHLDASLRSDRVIANQWDMTVTLCEGRVDDEHLAMLKKNVPLQEEGRIDARSIVLSRANKSVRNFEYVVGELAAGRQPSYERVATVGYLYRTTAVYGSGKFGMADWNKVRTRHPDLARPFAAEMLTCYMIRQFSLEQADYLAQLRSPETAVPMSPRLKRYFGIGNATGLGMAPFLVNHPLLISRWVETRETALARIVAAETPDRSDWMRLGKLIAKARQHLQEISTDNEPQQERNLLTESELVAASGWIDAEQPKNWQSLLDKAAATWDMETQEVLNSLLMELYPELIDDLENNLSVDEDYKLHPEQSLRSLRETIESYYAWALAIDFDAPDSQAVFWYRSKEKLEPRLGTRGVDPGDDKAMNIAVALQVRQCYDRICREVAESSELRVAEFAIAQPELRGIIRRIQTMSQTVYADIHANLLDADVLPIHLLRCKLSFFGVSKFDPKSRLWVRNTMFQGAPISDDIGKEFNDDWYFPVMPSARENDPLAKRPSD